jgi:Heterokaryon incompatibility protein (HET)
MARYCYQPLENDNQGIRLLRLMPGPHIAARIECELFHAKIEDCPPYEALSYTWGDASQTTDIDLSGCLFPATVNLDVALRYLRSRSEPRVLWVDAVCINQADLEEMAAQVRMMWEVYKNASRVVVWLGPEVGDSAVAMENIGRRDCQAKAVARRVRPDGKCSCHAGNFNFASRIGVQNLLNSRWFTRVWVSRHSQVISDKVGYVCADISGATARFYKKLPQPKKSLWLVGIRRLLGRNFSMN